MFSLLCKAQPNATWPLSLELPPLDFTSQNFSLTSELDASSSSIQDKKIMLVTACIHIDRKHYAKNMCNNCYHILGRSKNAWACTHTDQKLYAKGKCHRCYLDSYHTSQKKRKRR